MDNRLTSSDSPRAWLKWAKHLPLLVCALVFAFHFSTIARYAVNLPTLDDWALIADHNHPASVDLRWLHKQHNEHRTATTKLWVWLQFQINGWNVRTHQVLNFLWYGILVGFLVFVIRKLMPETPLWLLLIFTIFLLSPLIWLMHSMAYGIATHFWLLFFLIAAFCLFTEPQRWSSIIIGSLAGLASIYSFAAGTVTAVVMLGCFLVFKSVRIYQSAQARSRELVQLILVVVVFGAGIGTWFVGFFHPSHHPQLVLPYRRLFWSVYANLISTGFGVERVSTKLGALFFLAVTVPLVGIFWQTRGRLSAPQWAWFTILVALLADLAVISCARAGFGIGVSKALQYSEHGTPLIVLTTASWWVFLRRNPRLRAAILIGLWVVCFWAFLNNWNFDIYKQVAAPRLEGVRCARAYYAGKGDGICPTVYPPARSIAPFLDNAKGIDASFYRELSSQPANPEESHQR